MIGTLIDEAEKGQDARPGAAIGHMPGLAAAIKQLAQPLKAVGGVKDRVVPRQKPFAALREEDNDHAHDDTHGGPVNVLRIELVATEVERGRVAVYEQFSGLSNAFAQDFGQIGLAFAAVVDRRQQGTGLAFFWRHPQRGGYQRAKGIEFVRKPAFCLPLFEFPFSPGVVVEAGKDYAP
ncbi:MAG TPA: hypothetical protein PLD73_15705, partial [Candidatus Hydrogenedentes bacterium]|nr:hypothetical protein [Candidatus Hydrogenedentota bacterium]